MRQLENSFEELAPVDGSLPLQAVQMVNVNKNQKMMGKLEFLMLKRWKRAQKLVARTSLALHLMLEIRYATKILDVTNKIKAMHIFLANSNLQQVTF